MFTYRVYRNRLRWRTLNRKDLTADIDAATAMTMARKLAADCVVELWRGRNLIATFRPDTRRGVALRAVSFLRIRMIR